MIWEVQKISENQKGRSTPYASVGRGKIALSAAACELIDDNEQYNYAELLKGTEDGKTYVGIRLLREYKTDSIKIKRKQITGKQIAGMTIENKYCIEKLFGVEGIQKGTTRLNVRLDADEKNIIVICKR